jgi:two-component system, NarL family, nitrate/nitrite response regulator NarL
MRENLSPRETEVMHALLRGASNKVIARELGIAVETVKVHMKAILLRLNAANRTHAAVLFHTQQLEEIL